MRVSRNHPTPRKGLGSAVAFTEVQPQFSTSMPAGEDGDRGEVEGQEQGGDHEGGLAGPDPEEEEQTGHELHPGQDDAHQVREDGPAHLPLVDDLGEGRGGQDLVVGCVEEHGREPEAAGEQEAPVAQQAHGSAPVLVGNPASVQAGQPSLRIAAWMPFSRSLRATTWLASHP